ncbi:hypothetical protein PRIPAC_70479 [Pristionchus pacificus]|uniref:Uncharacterized protein n=1 Tax=Pristionchus pacificus TaxID=54126 RepID=A0A2A6BF93_PRIPA|nr:hypothetical protein PRIPAC_70479 [Pristionchus pacificus]|eukprot:PDM64538.1 hypothetical protein PRIPAC_52794 [Pristionchus pacificus]
MLSSSRLLLRSLRGAVARAGAATRADTASNAPAIFLPASARKDDDNAATAAAAAAAAERQSLVLPKGAEVDPLEGPSGLRTEDLMAALRQAYYEEDPETAMTKSTDTSRESGAPAFRRIIYSEGELDASDLSKPPSRSNPHPLDTSLLPPSHARSLTPYVNHVPLLKRLVDVGVDLFEIECKYPAVPRHLLRLPYAEAREKIRWLVSIVFANPALAGFTPDSLGDYITRNPYVLLQKLDDMKARVNYLASIKFNRKEILKLVSEFRFWLNIDVKSTEKRLDTVTGMFGLRKSAMRQVLVKEPRLLMFGLGPIKRIWDLLTVEFGFTAEQVKDMLMDDPRLFIMDSRVLAANYGYATRVMGVQPAQLVQQPLLLRVAPHALRSRHEFLRTLGRARYTETQPAGKGLAANEVISLSDLLLPSDAQFAERVARVTPASYDIYLRTH